MAITRRVFLLGVAGMTAGGGDGFRNPIVGGGGALVRKSVHSPNYTPGVQGWTVNQDGSSEFQGAIVRGRIVVGADGTPQVVLETNPSDSTGAIRFAPNDAAWNNAGGMYIRKLATSFQVLLETPAHPPSGSACVIILTAPDSVTNLGSIEILSALLSIIMDDNTGIISLSGGKLQVGNGPAGGYYYERVNLDTAQAIANNAFVQLVGMTVGKAYTDYGSAWNLATGVWTCPEDGVYTIDYKNWYAGWVAGSRMQMRVLLNGTPPSAANTIAGDDFTPTTTSVPFRTVPLTRDFTKNDALRFITFQNTGASTTLSSGSAQHNYISIRKGL